MTVKQEKILATALALFAKKGYDATSTSSVAKQAGVSEGLIFKHFTNKEGLLNAIVEQGSERGMQLFAPLYEIEDPRKLLKAYIQMPLKLNRDGIAYWKLIFSLKWQADVYDMSKTKPILEMLSKTFKTLGYKKPKAEAEALVVIMDGFAMAIMLDKPVNIKAAIGAVLEKYDL